MMAAMGFEGFDSTKVHRTRDGAMPREGCFDSPASPSSRPKLVLGPRRAATTTDRKITQSLGSRPGYVTKHTARLPAYMNRRGGSPPGRPTIGP